MSDLLKNNDHIYQELRKATEKYLNQRVENSKLKDEIQILQAQLEGANTQLKKLSAAGSANQYPASPMTESRQQIRLKSRTNKHEQAIPSNPSLSISASSIPGGSAQMQRNPSNSSGLLQRENEDLKRRVKDLEKECFQLTYYQQELQRRGGLDP